MFGVAASLLVAEGALRVLDVAAPPVTTRQLDNLDAPGTTFHCYASNPHDEFRPLPDLTHGRWRLTKRLVTPVELPLDRAAETPWCVEYRNGSTGVRGPAVAPLPAPGTLRIAGIGDSFAYGDGVPEDRTLFAQLQQELGPGFEVLNCGQSGADMELDLRTLEWVSGNYAPQRAIVVFLPNDVRLSPELQARQSGVVDLINLRAENATTSGASPWSVHSRLTQLLAGAGSLDDVTRQTLSLYRDAYDPAKNGENLQRLEADLRRLAQLSRGGVALVLYPLLIGFEDGYPLQHVHDRVRKMAEAAGLPVLDLAPAFAGHDTASLWVHDVDHHPNGAAHQIAAQALATWLRSELPQFLEGR